MIVWNLTYQATATSQPVTKTLANWGITNFKRRRVSQAPDEISFTTAEKSTTDPQFAYDGKVTVAAVKDGASTTWFVGWIGDPAQSLSGTQERRNYKAKNAWKWFDQIVFQKIWYRAVVPTSADSSLIGGYRSQMILNMGFNGSHQTIQQQMTDVVTFVNQVATQQGLGDVIQLGVCPVTTPPWSDVNDITVGEVVKHQMRWMPDAVTAFDYTTTPPTLNITKVLTPLTINLADDVIGAVSLTPRNDRVVERVRIKYAQQNNTNGRAWVYDIWDVYPLPAEGPVDGTGRPLGIFLAEAVGGGYYYQYQGQIKKSSLVPINYASPSATAASAFAASFSASTTAYNAALFASSLNPPTSQAASDSYVAANALITAANAAVAALSAAVSQAAAQVPPRSETIAELNLLIPIAAQAASNALAAQSSALDALGKVGAFRNAEIIRPLVPANVASTKAAAVAAAAAALATALTSAVSFNVVNNGLLRITKNSSVSAIEIVAPENTFKELLLSVNLVGFTSTSVSATIQTMPWGSEYWLKQKLPFLRATGSYLNNYSLKRLLNQDGSEVQGVGLANDVITGSLVDGLRFANGDSVIAQQYTAIYELNHQQTIAGTKNSKSADTQTVKFTATNASSGTYSGLQSSSSGDPIPAGLAQSLYDGLKILQHDGSVTIKTKEIDLLKVWIGNKLNIVGGSSYWDGMMIQTVEESVDTASVTVSVGVPRYLSAGDLVELLRVNRVRQRYIAPSTVQSGQGRSDATAALPKNTNADNSVGGHSIHNIQTFTSHAPVNNILPEQRLEAVVNAEEGFFKIKSLGNTVQELPSGIFVASGSAISMALSDCNGRELSVREYTICENNVSKKVLLLGSAPYL